MGLDEADIQWECCFPHLLELTRAQHTTRSGARLVASADHDHLLASFAGGVDIHDGREAHELTAGVQLAYALAFTMTENEGAPTQSLSESLVLLQREIAGLVLALVLVARAIAPTPRTHLDARNFGQ